MISGDNKKSERGSMPASAADALTEAQRIAAALARAEARIALKEQAASKAAAIAASAAPRQSAVSPPSAVIAPSAATAPGAAPAPSTVRAIAPEKPAPRQSTGFDPYNSGSFDRKHAWAKSASASRPPAARQSVALSRLRSRAARNSLFVIQLGKRRVCASRKPTR